MESQKIPWFQTTNQFRSLIIPFSMVYIYIYPMYYPIIYHPLPTWYCFHIKSLSFPYDCHVSFLFYHIIHKMEAIWDLWLRLLPCWPRRPGRAPPGRPAAGRSRRRCRRSPKDPSPNAGEGEEPPGKTHKKTPLIGDA